MLHVGNETLDELIRFFAWFLFLSLNRVFIADKEDEIITKTSRVVGRNFSSDVSYNLPKVQSSVLRYFNSLNLSF